ncbi:MAG: hypothetical protein VX768_13110 [Planctomycetota bacterium]|nr:hypothetical protein [Planctomycetota bacterium]
MAEFAAVRAFFCTRITAAGIGAVDFNIRISNQLRCLLLQDPVSLQLFPLQQTNINHSQRFHAVHRLTVFEDLDFTLQQPVATGLVRKKFDHGFNLLNRLVPSLGIDQ